jgi:hypothetical protein
MRPAPRPAEDHGAQPAERAAHILGTVTGTVFDGLAGYPRGPDEMAVLRRIQVVLEDQHLKRGGHLDENPVG